MKKIGSLSFGH